MIFWSLCAFFWFKNMKKMLLQMTSGFLELESTLYGKYSTQTMIFLPLCAFIWLKNMKKIPLQMTSVFLQLESTIYCGFLFRSYFNFGALMVPKQNCADAIELA
jgi:hypothetical protein